MTRVPFSRPYLPGGEAESIAETIASGWVAQGPRVRAFERAWAERVGAAESVAVSSGTTALHLALVASGVGPGDEVIVPSLSFIATANAVWHCGARPVFADIDPATLNLDPAAAEARITPATKAIMPVHQLGLPADLQAFRDIGRRHGVAIIEDAACAIGGSYAGEPIGGGPTVACFSLHARKVITTGEGGMITTPDPDQAARLRRLRHHGMDVSDLVRHAAEDVVFERYLERAWNARMTDIQAAMGLTQLSALDDAVERRRAIAERYHLAVDAMDGLSRPAVPDGVIHTWQSYAVRLDPSIDRTAVMRGMLADGIATRRGPTAIHLQDAYAEEDVELPATEAADREVLLLPIFPDLAEGDQDRVIESLRAHLVAQRERTWSP